MDAKRQKQPRFPDEFRERAVRPVGEQQKGDRSQWARTQSISARLGCNAWTWRRWPGGAGETDVSDRALRRRKQKNGNCATGKPYASVAAPLCV